MCYIEVKQCFVVIVLAFISTCVAIGTSAPSYTTGTTIAVTSPLSIAFGSWEGTSSLIACSLGGVWVSDLAGVVSQKANPALSSCPYVLGGVLGLSRKIEPNFSNNITELLSI